MTSTSARAGIELGGTKALCRVTDAAGVMLGEVRLATQAPAVTVGELGAFLRRTLSGRALGALGVASFGPLGVDPRSASYGRLLATPKPLWGGFDLRGALSAEVRTQVLVDTDVNAAALAEQALGAGRGCASLAYVTVGTGIGAGLAIEGTPLRGILHPEAGHLRLPRRPGDTHLSTCPFHADCVEGLAAGPAVAARRKSAPSLESLPEQRALVGGYLADLAAALVLTWAPERIVLGGGVMATPGLLAEVRGALPGVLNGYGPTAALAPDYLVAASLKDSGLEGAILMAGRALT